MRWHPSYQPNGWPLAHNRAHPGWVQEQLQVGSEHVIAYATEIPLGVVPLLGGSSLFSGVKVTVALRLAESGADSSNYSQVEIRAGTTASYTTLATITTASGPAALELLTSEFHKYLDPGDLIFAYWTRTGAARDYSGEYGMVVLDVLGERQP